MRGIRISANELALLSQIANGSDCARLILRTLPTIKRGSLYTTLQRLEKKDFVASKKQYRNESVGWGWGHHERAFMLTKRGRAVLKLVDVLS